MKVLTDNQHYQDIAEAILAKTGGTTPLKPAEMAQALNDLNIDLEEVYITPTTEEQIITPSEGYYGISKIFLGAAPESGGDSGDGGGTGGDDTGGDYPTAEDTTFGDEYEPYVAYYDAEGNHIFNAPPPPSGRYVVMEQTNTRMEDMYDAYVYAFVADSQFHYDGFVLKPNAAAAGGVTRYECDVSSGETEWKNPISLTTTGHEYCDWANHNVYRTALGGTMLHTEKGTYESIYQPTERDEDYTIGGDTLNDLVGAAQAVTGSKEPMTPEEAANALKEYSKDKWEGGSY